MLFVCLVLKGIDVSKHDIIFIRHEPPIVGNIHFIQETEDLIAVCKPASLPMHPCGAYRHNSLTSILAAVIIHSID